MTITYDITGHVLTGRDTAVVRDEIPRGELAAWLAQVFAEVGEHLTRTGTSFAGPAFARFTFLGDRVAVEAGFPVLGEIAGEGRVQPSRLPDGPAAVTVHRGRYEDLEQAYVAINEWLSARGGVPRGPHWEYYYTDPRVEPDPARWRTEVVVPYE